MKKVFRDTCILSSLMILTVFSVSIIWSGITGEIALVFQLFGLSFILSIVNNVFDDIVSLPILYSNLVKYIVVTCMVILFGFIVGWFCRSNFWNAFIYVAIVFIMAYFLDIFVTEKDVTYINQKIRERDNRNL